MTDSRISILANIRRSLASARLPEPPVAAMPAATFGQSVAELAERFAAELTALSGAFQRVARADLTNFVVQVLREREATELLAWRADQLPAPEVVIGLRTAGVTVRDGELPRGETRSKALAEIAQVTVGLTGAEAVLAETGTLALLAGPGRPRLASMSVRTHIALITPEQLYPSMAAWLASRKELRDEFRTRAALTFVTGPSRTADIEMTLTVGVHGPAEVIVVLVGN
ncbi:MAG: LutC/YkgG family protein [Anaerolineales bacterium]